MFEDDIETNMSENAIETWIQTWDQRRRMTCIQVLYQAIQAINLERIYHYCNYVDRPTFERSIERKGS